jgi:pimeloyl-ACP methyl ester carboxylesterase
MHVLYLPGLDGEGFTAGKLQEHLRTVRLEVFAYPVGLRLEWGTLCRLVIARTNHLQSGLLLGESFGGAVAQETMLRHGESLASVFLVSTFAREPEPFAAMLGRAAARVLPRTALRPVAKRLAAWKLAGTLTGEERNKFLGRFATVDPNEMAARLKLLRSFDTRTRLASVKLPVEVAYGTRDTMCSAPEQLQAWQTLPDCRIHAVEGFGHLVSAEAAVQVAQLIEAWALRYGKA